MEKKILVIEGSPRVGGNTDLLSDEFIKGAKENGNIVEKIYLQKKKINYCVDCEMCRKNGGKCVQKDDFQEVCDKIIEADVLVIVSPVYYYSVSAQMKTLIDRTYSALEHISNKECFFITAGAGDDEKYFKTIIDTYYGFINCFPNMKDAGIVLGIGAQEKGSIKENKAMKEAYELGKTIK